MGFGEHLRAAEKVGIFKENKESTSHTWFLGISPFA